MSSRHSNMVSEAHRAGVQSPRIIFKVMEESLFLCFRSP